MSLIEMWQCQAEFRDDDPQVLGPYICVRNFEVKILGEWFPVDFYRFKKSHPRESSEVLEDLREQLEREREEKRRKIYRERKEPA